MIKTFRRIIGLCAITSLLALSITSCQQPTGGNKTPVPEVKELNLTYAELETEIPKLTPGTYNLTVDTTGVTEDQFKIPDYEGTPSPFVQKLKTAKDGVLFNLKLIFPYEAFGDTMFFNCTNLLSIVIPDSITSIGEVTFSNCSALKKVTIGCGVIEIKWFNVFAKGPQIEEIIVSPKNKTYSTKEGVVYTKKSDELILYPNNKKDTNFTIPNGIKYIVDNAFNSCKNLTTVTIPESVKSIGDSAFNKSSITTINYAGTEEEWKNITGIDSAKIPTGCTVNYSSTN